jgi:hypothetical protein
MRVNYKPISIRTNILLSLMLLILSSCSKDHEKRVIHFLTNGSDKYWIKVEESPGKPYLGINFAKNGAYTEFTEPGKGSRIRQTVSWRENWKLDNDSTIAFTGQGNKFRIVYFNDDILILNNLDFKQLNVYEKSPDQKTVPKEDKTDHSRHL